MEGNQVLALVLIAVILGAGITALTMYRRGRNAALRAELVGKEAELKTLREAYDLEMARLKKLVEGREKKLGPLEKGKPAPWPQLFEKDKGKEKDKKQGSA